MPALRRHPHSPSHAPATARSLLSLPRAVLAALLAFTPLTARADATTLDVIRARGSVVCGVVEEAPGYSVADAKGEWTGLAVDFCRALALAVLGKRDAITIKSLTPGAGLDALRDPGLDVVTSDVEMSAGRDTGPARFPGVLAYDAQGFMVRRAQGVTSALELSGLRVCVVAQRGDAQSVLDYFAGLKIPVEVVKLERWKDVVSAYEQKSCQVLSGSLSHLAAARSHLARAPDHVVLPERTRRLAYGPAVRSGDEVWFGAVRWTLFALVAAEELGVTSGNVEQMAASARPDVQRYLSGGRHLSAHLGLEPEWTRRLVRQLGNYGELYERHLGAKSPLRLERKANNVADRGGLLVSPAFD